MSADTLQQYMRDEREESGSTPDFRFTNYTFTEQHLSEEPLPQSAADCSNKLFRSAS